MFALKIRERVFSGSVEARILKLDIHMNDELRYSVIDKNLF